MGRGVQGIGGGLVVVALYVVVGRAYPERLRPSIMASFSAAWVVPVIVGPLVAGTVTEQFGWRWVFLAIPVLILLPLVVMLPALRKLPRNRPGPSGGVRQVLGSRLLSARAGRRGGRLPAAVRGPAPVLVRAVARRRRTGPAGARHRAAAAPRYVPGGAWSAERGAAARTGRRGAGRRREFHPADAGHPARTVRHPRRALAHRRRADLGARFVRADPAAAGAVPGAADGPGHGATGGGHRAGAAGPDRRGAGRDRRGGLDGRRLRHGPEHLQRRLSCC